MRIAVILLTTLTLVYAWNYIDQANWEGRCTEGEQSPIDLDTDGTDEIDSDLKLKMVLLSKTTSSTVVNTGNMIRVDVDMGFVEIGSGDDLRAFSAKTLEFHTPSEHTVDGVQYALEMHVVMTAIDRYIERDEPNMLILSVLYKPGDKSYLLDELEVLNLPGNAGASTTLKNSTAINIRDEVWATDEYYFYEGTATHPDYDCREDVYWYVIEEIKEAAAWQIDKFKEAFPTNNSRLIDETSSFSVYYSDAETLTIAALMVNFFLFYL